MGRTKRHAFTATWQAWLTREERHESGHPGLALVTVLGVQPAADAIESLLEAPAHSALRDAQATRDVGGRGAVKETKHEGLPEGLFEPHHGFGNDAMDLAIADQLLRAGNRADVRGGHGLLPPLAPTRAPPTIDGEIPRHAGKPRTRAEPAGFAGCGAAREGLGNL
jgi:hypothetical protein